MSTYTVQSGDTLKSIAREVLGDESLAQYLASINNIQGVPGVAGDWFYPVTPGQKLEVGAAEVTARYNYTPWIIGALLLGGTVWYVTKN